MFKKYKLPLFFMAIFGFNPLIASAQTPKGDTTKIVINALTANDVKSLLPQITPKSPNVSALEKHDNYPVSMYSGLANVEIPLYEIKVGNLSVPIKLSYHGSGNKVNDNASWVGMGWNLGGDFSIMRNIRGRADEADYANGNSLLQSSLPNLAQFTTCLTEQLKSDFNQYVSFGKDVERDIFTYHTPTKSNSFVLLPNQTGVIWQESDKSILSYTGALQSLTLRDESGIQYTYGTPEITLSSLTGAGATSAWHLNSMQGLKATDKILFTYQANSSFSVTDEIVDTEVYHTDISGLNASSIPVGWQNNFYSTDSPIISAQLLQEITFPMGKVVFVPSTAERQDNLGKSLDAIEIYGYNVSTNLYDLIKKYTFTYVYKQRTGSYTGDVVMFLDKVNLVTNDNTNTVLGSYSFNYNSQALPSRTSRARDYWGYYNGQTQNTTLIPSITLNTIGYSPQTQTYYIGGANREVNALTAKAWVLEKITYPTGGFTTFDYENNQYADATGQHLAGGLRIKQMVSNDGASNTTTKTYKYGTGESGNGTIRSLAYKNYETVQLVKSVEIYAGAAQYNYNIRTFSSALNRGINANEGSTVTYPVVTEYEDDGTGANGKAVYTFKDDASDDLITIPSNGKSAQRNRFWNRGQLLSKITYGNDGLKKYEQTNTYTVLSTGETATIGYLIGKSESRLNSSSPDPSTNCLINDDSFNPVNPITWNYGLVKQTASIEKYYDNQDQTKFTSKQSQTAYSSTHFQPTEIKSIVSNSIVLGKLLWYPQDFATVPTTATVTGDVNALRALQQANVLTLPIEEIDYRKDLLALAPPDAPYLIVTGGKFTTFDVLSSSGVQKAIVPKSIAIIECLWNTFLNQDNTINFTPAAGLFNPTINTATIPRNVNHKTRIYFDTYDTDGNLLTFHPSDGITTKYTYGSSSNGGLSFVYPTAEIQNYLSTNPNGIKSLSSTFDFTIPLLGMVSTTDPSGLKSYFEYDTFGRLLQIKDHDSKIVKKYQYKY